MKVVIDVNIVIAALIKDSKIREIIKSSGFDYYFPEISFHKIVKYRKYIIKKAGISVDEFTVLLVKLFSHIKLVSRKEMLDYREEAKRIMKKTDEEDVPILTAALCLGNNIVIWSDDKHFDKQKRIRVLKTEEIISLQ